MKKVFLLACLLIVGYTVFSYFISPAKTFISNGRPTVKINNTVYMVDIADSDAKRSQGLSGRQKLENDEGLLFLFDTKETYAFWMKDMLFPIDIIWISDDTIVDISENVPIPLTATYLPKYQPRVQANRVLEVNAGEAKKRNIKIGDKIILTLIKQGKSVK